eukprot:TRINITY_DN5_c1_g3_i2.p1 TRINITY_DN5_c1_g3~~TRINITY_DN5_c1_g3_i2.p1  ORF type:complete len:770 (-),score=258.58 TRINITY_DN5_c1_g3_i2:112-2421(-)
MHRRSEAADAAVMARLAVAVAAFALLAVMRRRKQDREQTNTASDGDQQAMPSCVTPTLIRSSLSTGPLASVQEQMPAISNLGSSPSAAVQDLPTGGPGGRRLELLIHNISHKDMVFSLCREESAPTNGVGSDDARDQGLTEYDWSQLTTTDDVALARPRFSLFQQASEVVLAELDRLVREGERPRVACIPTQPRFRGEGRQKRDGSLGGGATTLAAGFDLSGAPIPVPDLSCYRVRSKDEQKLEPLTCFAQVRRLSTGDVLPDRSDAQSAAAAAVAPVPAAGTAPAAAAAQITGAFFPLLSALVPKWKRQVLDSGDETCEKVILLVSGVGTPRDRAHEPEGNSTEGTARLMEAFLALTHPDVKVVRVHSRTNLFRYDENIRFVKTELLPLVDAERHRMAEMYGSDWRDMMHLTISFADGSPARISSINASLRHYRPSYMHIWELKTFWHEGRICEDDVEAHTFEDIETAPATPPAEAGPLVAQVVAEMLRLRDAFVELQAQGIKNDLAQFWLRKTKKPVLAVLLVQKPGQEPKVYRGTNMEVSMPTGSLCAERNVIGTALADDLSLCRRDLRMVAVLAVTLAAPPPPATPQAQTPALQMPPDCFGRLAKAGSSVFNDTPCASPLLPSAGAFSSYRSESAGSQAEAQAFSSADATGFYTRARRRSESWPERGETNGVLVCQEERLSAAAHQHVHAPPLTRIGSCDSIIRTTDASAPNTPTHKPGHRQVATKWFELNRLSRTLEPAVETRTCCAPPPKGARLLRIRLGSPV